MNLNRSLALIAVAACVAMFSACYAPPAPGPGPNPGPVQPGQRPTVSWQLSPVGPHGINYAMTAIVNGKRASAGGGGEHFNPRFTSPGRDGVPSSALSGYAVSGPDGEDSSFYAVMRGGLVDIYKVDWDPFSGGYGAPQLMSTVNPY